jgi:hypothetical protein
MDKISKKNNITGYIAMAVYSPIVVVVALALIGTAYAISKERREKNSALEQKIQNEIIIDSTKVDTTNYQKTFNYPL